MKALRDFSPIAPDETQELAIDFATYLTPGDSISAVLAWNVSVAEKSLSPDPSPSSRKSGPNSLTGAVVVQTITGCLADVTYVMEAVVSTVSGETLSIWSYIDCVPAG